MDAATCDTLHREIRKGQIQACLIHQHGDLVFSYFRNRKSEAMCHPIHSCTKSVLSILVGICLDKGLIPDVHTPVKAFLPSHFHSLDDPRKETLTLWHLLTMSAGFDWPEFGAWQYGTPMEFSRDMIKFVLDRPLEVDPGIRMTYNSGCSHLLGAVVQNATGMKLLDFARSTLFDPLGIGDVTWHMKQGIHLAANGLKMKPRDMLALGELYLHEGMCGDKRIVSREWVAASTQPRFLTYPEIGHYGYHWWTTSLRVSGEATVSAYFALGLFGQYILVVPACDMVAVFVSANYGDSLKPLHLFRTVVAPSLSAS